MIPGYSRLLIHDLILPDTGASQFASNFDIVMLVFNSALERSRSQWTDLLRQAGFEVAQFWVDEQDADDIVEAIVPEQ